MRVQNMNGKLEFATSEMGVLIRDVVEALVSRPDRVSVSEYLGSRAFFEIQVHPSDIAVALGRRGVFMESLRLLMGAAGVAKGFKAAIELVDTGERVDKLPPSPRRIATEEELERVRQLIERMVRSVVDDSGQVVVHLTRGQEHVMYEIDVPHIAALRQTIGRGGAHMNALRALCDGMLGRLRQRGTLHLMETKFEEKAA